MTLQKGTAKISAQIDDRVKLAQTLSARMLRITSKRYNDPAQIAGVFFVILSIPVQISNFGFRTLPLYQAVL